MNKENNKLIADFMGFESKDGIVYKIPQFKYEENSFGDIIYGDTFSIYFDDMLFKTDWNWLMEVVEKIENTKTNNVIFDIFITKNKTHIHYSKNDEWFSNIFLHEGKTKIENTYNACVEFIKWYNEQKN